MSTSANASEAAAATSLNYQYDPEARPAARVFKFRPPDLAPGETLHGKHVTRLARTDRLLANVQVMKAGGENNLNSHEHFDGF